MIICYVFTYCIWTYVLHAFFYWNDLLLKWFNICIFQLRNTERFFIMVLFLLNLFQSAVLRPWPYENIQHHPERHWHDWISKEDYQKCCQLNKEAMQVSTGEITKNFILVSSVIILRAHYWIHMLTNVFFQGQSFWKAGKLEKWCQRYPKAQVSDRVVKHCGGTLVGGPKMMDKRKWK